MASISNQTSSSVDGYLCGCYDMLIKCGINNVISFDHIKFSTGTLYIQCWKTYLLVMNTKPFVLEDNNPEQTFPTNRLKLPHQQRSSI